MAISKSTSNVGKADFLSGIYFVMGKKDFAIILKMHLCPQKKKIKLTFWGHFLNFLKGTNSFILWEDYLLCRNITRHESSWFLIKRWNPFTGGLQYSKKGKN